MKLIQMTDFVLEQLNETNSRILLIREVLNRLENYANFLKQSLEFVFFFAYDHNGQIFGEFNIENGSSFEAYQLKKVLFIFNESLNSGRTKMRYKNKITNTYETLFVFNIERGYWVISEEWKNKTIEDLLVFDLNLTEVAIKQIGL